MARYHIRKLDPAESSPRHHSGIDLTIELPDIPPNVYTYRDLLQWIATDLGDAHQLHISILAIIRCFNLWPKPQ